MKQFKTPTGKAGCDQVDAIIESVHSELKQMFDQVAELQAFKHGVGRTVKTENGPNSKIQLDAQKRECEAQIVSHGGRALELALHVVYARGADRIIGREYPGVSEKQMKKDRKNHSLKSLYDLIVTEFSGRNMKEAFEDVYQTALHSGVTDLYLDRKHIWSFLLPESVPFKEIQRNAMMDGSEMTLDHSDGFRSLFGQSSGGYSTFTQMPDDSFESFLAKADAVYYEGDSDGRRRNMRWAGYSVRDHEYGRPYVIIGTEFFGRLVNGVVKLSDEQWTWDDSFKERWHRRRLYIINNIMNSHAMQNYKNPVDLPEMISVEESMRMVDEWKPKYPENYTHLHRKFELSSKGKDENNSK